jgi:hypothetical protein
MSQIWEVIGGTDKGGLVVRITSHPNSPPASERLSPGSLVVEVQRVGDRLLYDRIAGTGYGPDSGWVSTQAGDRELMVPVDVKPPKAGWKVLHKELNAWAPPKETGPALSYTQVAVSKPGNMAVGGPATAQEPGKPYTYYHQIQFPDTKPTGLRMSACYCCMDECRTEALSICDCSVSSYKKVTDSIVWCAIELVPAIKKLSSTEDDGLLHARTDATGAILSWLRAEMQIGFPLSNVRTEESNVYLVGKDKKSNRREKIARAMFSQALVSEGSILNGAQWEQDSEQYWSRLKEDHSKEALGKERNLWKYYPGGDPFKPTTWKKVSFLMGSCYSDLWGQMYHAKAPEMLWDVNKTAGGAFEALVDGDEVDPQAMAVAFPAKMTPGSTFDVFCFLEESKKKAVYVFLKKDGTASSDCVLAVCALYDWQATPQTGQTLRAEDVEICNGPARSMLVGFVDGKEAKATRLLDLTAAAPAK